MTSVAYLKQFVAGAMEDVAENQSHEIPPPLFRGARASDARS